MWRATLGKCISLEEMRRVLAVNPCSWRMMDNRASKLGSNVLSHAAWMGLMFIGAKRPIALRNATYEGFMLKQVCASHASQAQLQEGRCAICCGPW